MRIGDSTMERVPIERAGDFDCVIVTTDHTSVDYKALVERSQLVIDTRNVTKGLRQKYSNKVFSI